MLFKPARTPGTLKIGRKLGPRAPKISSDCPRKPLDFEIGVGDRLGTLKVSKSKRLFSIQNASQRSTTFYTAWGPLWKTPAARRSSV